MISFGLHWKIGIYDKKAVKKMRVWKRKGANWDLYKCDLENRLSDICLMDDLSKNYEKIIKCMKDAATENIGSKIIVKGGKKKSKPWWNERVSEEHYRRVEMNRNMRKARRRLERGENGGEVDLERMKSMYEEQKKKVSQVIYEEKLKVEEQMLKEWKELGPGERERVQWKYMKQQLNGNDDEPKVLSMKVNGRVSDEEEEVKGLMEEYWRKIFTSGLGEQRVNGLKGGSMNVQYRWIEGMVRITEEELEFGLRRLKKNKSEDMDGIIGEFLKYGGENLKMMLLRLFNDMLLNAWVPEEWLKSRVKLIYKGGGKSRQEISSYRPIAIVSVLSKLFCSILAKKLKDWQENEGILSEEQNGFREGRSTLDNLYILRMLVDNVRKKNGSVYVQFLDLEKAFDSVDRKKLLGRLNDLNVNESMVSVIKSMYEGNFVKLNLGEIESRWIKNNVGVRQGCTLSPVLFGLFIDELLVRIKSSGIGIRMGERLISCLGFADDIMIVSENGEDLQSLFNVCEKYEQDWKLKFSADKCKIMIFGNGRDEG